MKQVVIESGGVTVEQVPAPVIRPGHLVVRVVQSLVSAGTELAGVSGSSPGLLRRLRQKPRRALKAIEHVRERGLMQTWRLAQNAGLGGNQTGYSCAGRVIEVASDVTGYSVGDRVACAGAGKANHAEYVCVPVNLVTKLPDPVSFEAGCSATVGAIALQGVRRGAPQLGEFVVVVGVGLIGQLTVQLLKATGARVIAVDVDPARVALARLAGAEFGVEAGGADVVSEVMRCTGGRGADLALLTAATPSKEPLNQAMAYVRKKGRVVVVGDVGLALDRSPFYEKEIDLLISCSYGPGRYDPEYEEEGVDYPYGYVRWTENRNMEEFLRLIASDVVKISLLGPRAFAIDDAARAYGVLAPPPRALYATLAYPGAQTPATAPARSVALRSVTRDGRLGIAVIGAGGFAASTHLPNLLRLREQVRLDAVVSRSGHSALRVARQFEASSAATSADEVFASASVDAVIIATRHDSHAELAIAAARAGKAVFLEKPLALSEDGLDRVMSEIRRTGVPFTVGYNRRFAPASVEARRLLASRREPLSAMYRANAGFIPASHWVHGPEGGGRLVGEACHMVDLLRCFAASPVVDTQLTAISPGGRHRDDDNFLLALRYADGSMGAVLYTASGHAALPKERCELFFEERAIVLDDFSALHVHGVSGGWSGAQDKGHAELLARFLAHCRGGPAPIPLDEIEETSRVTLRAAAELARWRQRGVGADG